MVGAMPVNLIPKFCNGAMDSCNGTEGNEIQVQIGSRIKSNDDFGTVKYIGEVHGYKGIWYGVEWDNPARGKHDGSLDDVQYFKTSKPGAGSFIRPNKIAPLTTCAEAIRHSYGGREDETVAAQCKSVINEWKREMGAPFIEMVGFEKIHQKQKFDRLLEVSVHDQNVAKAGDLAALCPNLRSLDASRNLFREWREIITLAAQLPNLAELNLSNNRMAIDMTEETLSQMSNNFAALEKINISVGDYEWSDVLALSRLWPSIVEIVAAYNRISVIMPPLNTMQTLTTLKLDGNPIASWDQVMSLGSLPNLVALSLNECLIPEIRFNDNPHAKLNVFHKLQVIYLSRNRISDWRSISELGKLCDLKKLYFLKNPVQNTENYDECSQLIIAKIGTLQELNGSAITSQMRRGAEYDYLKRHGAEWKLVQGDHAQKVAFDNEHCRFEALVRHYGLPEDSLLAKEPENQTLQSQLLQITLRDESGKTFKKKFPCSMEVRRLGSLTQKLFKKNGNTGSPTLYLLDDTREGIEILMDEMKDLYFYSAKNNDTILVRFTE